MKNEITTKKQTTDLALTHSDALNWLRIVHGVSWRVLGNSAGTEPCVHGGCRYRSAPAWLLRIRCRAETQTVPDFVSLMP